MIQFVFMNLSALSLLVLYSEMSVYHSSALHIMSTGDDIFSIADPSAMSYILGILIVQSICLLSCCIAIIAIFFSVANSFSVDMIVLIFSGWLFPGASIIPSQSTNITSHPLSDSFSIVSDRVSMS